MTPSSTAPRSWIQVLGLSLGLPIIIALMLFAFLAPATSSGPEDLPLAVTGPAPAVEQLSLGLQEQLPGGFEIRESASHEELQKSIHNRETIGGIAVDPVAGTTVYTAAGNGSPYAALLTQFAEGLRARGQQVTTVELAPVSENDPQGTGIAMLGMPLAFGGMISAALLTLAFRGRMWHRMLGSLGVSLIGGLVVALILQSGYELFDPELSVWAIAGVIALGIAATSLAVTGLGSLIGIPGVAIGAVLTIFVANPLAGLASGWWWLPAPWGIIGQYLPIGATGDLLRSVAFFDGQGGTRALWVLLTWALVGALLIILGSRRERRATPESD